MIDLDHAFSAYPSYSISKAISQKQVDIAAVKASDCKNNICNPFITALSSYTMSGSTYTLKDISTGKDLSASALSTICYGIQAPLLVVPNIGSLTISTSGGGLNTSTIIGIVAGGLVLIGIAVWMFRQRAASQQTKARVIDHERQSGQYHSSTPIGESTYYYAQPASPNKATPAAT
ncbi:Aste57867_12341 [Aphanomyces stellatus]|uniref:Aste57867_12341 protein n=1 Tax=Aphanomyces stellatus TaxID=120398 RepID=A0A485KVQ4_9STRA|nr:hypothetical protein As57867_012295 [Aphanomyces stellatus]VFT89193.1 Aste57867_12341 [Aphanomyces stellatus]